jgi:hypothetical protein
MRPVTPQRLTTSSTVSRAAKATCGRSSTCKQKKRTAFTTREPPFAWLRRNQFPSMAAAASFQIGWRLGAVFAPRQRGAAVSKS